MSKHTPEPLVVEDDESCLATYVMTKENQAVAQCSWTVAGIEKEEAQANAYLYAAAPDLLMALEAFLRAPHSGSSGPGYSTIEVTDFNLKVAIAAIDKAKKTL